MNDLGKITYEKKRHFFNSLTVHHIVINPKVTGYPPLFLICSDFCGSRPCEFAVGITFCGLNQLLMQHASAAARVAVAAALGEALSDDRHRGIIGIKREAGKALKLMQLDAETTVCRFDPDPNGCESPLYFFRLNEG